MNFFVYGFIKGFISDLLRKGNIYFRSFFLFFSRCLDWLSMDDIGFGLGE